jgi:tol-pal system protein YbgF
MQDEATPVGARGGREPGSPLDLSTLANVPGAAQPQQPQQRNAPTSAVASVAPVTQVPQSPKDEYDFAYGYIQAKDYALAEQNFREFLRKYPSDRLSPEAQYWLGESLFQRQRYRDAAENFLSVSTKHETSAKAPDSLLRLAQSLAALGERDAACATLGEIGRKYPRASVGVKRGAEREQKRVSC